MSPVNLNVAQRTPTQRVADRKDCLTVSEKAVIALIAALLIPSLFPYHTSAEASIGVKTGDWAEYEAYYVNGRADDTPEITGYRIEVKTVQGKNVSLTITTKLGSKTSYDQTTSSSIDAGMFNLPFLAPANLNKDDVFNATVSVRPVKVIDVVEREYAGVKRTVLSTDPSFWRMNIFVKGGLGKPALYWDRATGVLAEVDFLVNQFGMHHVIKLSKTNMWENGPDLVRYLEIASLIAFAALTMLVIVRWSRKKTVRHGQVEETHRDSDNVEVQTGDGRWDFEAVAHHLKWNRSRGR